MFTRQKTGSVVCTACGSLVGVRDDKCYNCGRRNPGMWGFAPLLRSLEEAATRDVAILQLQPDAHLRVVKLTAEARSQEAMFAYLRRLAAAKNLGDTHLVSHQVQRDDPQRPIQFSVQAALR